MIVVNFSSLFTRGVWRVKPWCINFPTSLKYFFYFFFIKCI